MANRPSRQSRIVLTTGANSGIGLATAVELAKRGFHSVGSVRRQGKAGVVKDAAAAAGVEVDTVLLDVTDAARGAEVIGELRPWGLVNNAGYAVTGAIEDIGDDEAMASIETMVMAPMRFARLALPHMRDAGGGCIVNMSSIAGRATAPLLGWYTASKHALEALTDALRVEVAGAGVRVVLVEPGGFKTGIWEEAEVDVARRTGSRYASAYRRSMQGVRLTEPVMGSPQRVANVVAHAMTARIALPRYLVGVDARALAIAEQLTPTLIKDMALRLGLGL